VTAAAALALVAVVGLVVIGLDRRDAVTLGAALALEDVVMVGNLVVLGLLCAAVAYVWLRGRAAGRAAEQKRSDELAREAEKRRVEQAKAVEQAEVDAAVARRDAEKKRPGVDRANERLRRIVPILVLVLALPARAECRVEGPDTVCPTPEFDLLMDQLDAAEAQVVIEKAASKRLDEELRAARDRTAVTHPEPKPPILEVTVGTSIALLVGLVVGFLVGSGR
jgi:hypothetical protein